MTYSLGLPAHELKNTAYELLRDTVTLKVTIVKRNDLRLIPSSLNLSGIRLTTLKYYTELGILPFNQAEKRLTRKYKEKEVLERLKEIKKLKEKRLMIKEIIEHFKKHIK